MALVYRYINFFLQKLPSTKEKNNLGIEAIFEAYQKMDNTDDNPYVLLEKSEHYSIIHLLEQLTESSSSVV